jgi:S1-C subfamily serine protease
VPAVQLFSGAHADFHRPGDTADRIDSAGLVKTAQVLKEVVSYLAARPQALHPAAGGAQGVVAVASTPGERRVSLGFVPDYAAGAGGVRVAEVRTETPAARAGLRPGDVITALDDTPVRDLREYTQVLKELAPGDAVEILFRRNGTMHRVTARVTER